MKRMSLLLMASAILASVVGFSATASAPKSQDEAVVFVQTIPPGYRDWSLISVAREEGKLDDIRAVLGNDVAMKAFRAGTLPFPDGTIIARLAWSYDASEENNKAFGQKQSYIAGHPKNGVQFMIKDSKKYAATGGWGYGHFENGKSAEDSFLKACHPCHTKIPERDFVFTRYSQ